MCLLGTFPALSTHLPATGTLLSSPTHSLGLWALRDVLKPRLQEGYLGEKMHSSPTEGPIRSQPSSAPCSAAPLHLQSPLLRKDYQLGSCNPGRASHACKGVMAPGLDRPRRTRRALPAAQVGALWADKLPVQPVSLPPPCHHALGSHKAAFCTGEPTQRQDAKVMGSQSYVPLARGVSAHHDAQKHHLQSRKEPG